MARKKRHNSKQPSLVGDVVDYAMPTGLMERAARGNKGDFGRLTGAVMRNPNELSAESLAARLGMAAVVPGGVIALTALEVADAVNHGLLDETTGVLIKPMEAIGSLANPRRRRKRRNPEEQSAMAYEIFHGKPPQGTTEILEDIHEHENLWALGTLQELVINTLSGYQATFEFTTDNPWLCGNEPRESTGGLFGERNMVCTQLFLRGGDQRLNLKKIHMDEDTKWHKEQMVIGDLIEVTYHTEKGFDKFKPVDYYHALGEESGEIPIIIYDTRNKLLSIAGGQYEIKAEGITN